MGRECTFVEAVIPLNEILFDRDIPAWDDHTWAYIYKQLKPEHDPFSELLDGRWISRTAPQ